MRIECKTTGKNKFLSTGSYCCRVLVNSGIDPDYTFGIPSINMDLQGLWKM